MKGPFFFFFFFCSGDCGSDSSVGGLMGERGDEAVLRGSSVHVEVVVALIQIFGDTYGSLW